MKCLLSLALALMCATATAQTSYVDVTKLPDDPAIHQVMTNLLLVAPMASEWRDKWNFKEPKASVQHDLAEDLKKLVEAGKRYPDNEDLQLLTALTASYAYNLDVSDSGDVLDASVKAAATIAPQDYRPQWALAHHQCQTLIAPDGMNALLDIDSKHATLPRDFWMDEAKCAKYTSMPVHQLRALDRAGVSQQDNERIDLLKRFTPSRLSETYPADRAWTAGELHTGGIRFMNRTCGFAVTVPKESPVGPADVQKGTCVLTVESPYFATGKRSKSSATYLVLAQTPQGTETLQEFAKRMMAKQIANGNVHAISSLPCPATSCLEYEEKVPSEYPQEGGAHMYSLFFQTEEPAHPGLATETAIPIGGTGQNITYHRPGPVLQRLPGTLYFAVVMDASEAIHDRSKPGYEALLKSMAIDK